MPDNQDLANGIGATLRAAEAAATTEGATETAVHLASLHDQLGQAFHAVNTILDAAGMAPLDWNAIASNSSAASRSGGPVANSGGGNKGEPQRLDDSAG